MTQNNRNLFSHSSGGWKFKVKMLVGPCFLQRFWGRILPGFFSFLVVASNPWHSLACGSITPFSVPSSHNYLSCVSFVFSNRSLEGHQSLNLGLTRIQHDIILTRFHLHKPYFQTQPHSQVMERGLPHIFWGDQPTTMMKTRSPGFESESWSISSHVS